MLLPSVDFFVGIGIVVIFFEICLLMQNWAISRTKASLAKLRRRSYAGALNRSAVSPQSEPIAVAAAAEGVSDQNLKQLVDSVNSAGDVASSFKRLRRMEAHVYGPLKALSECSAIERSTTDIATTPPLSTEQAKIFDIAVGSDRPSIFFTGHAGTGKSFLLRQIIAHLSHLEMSSYKNGPESVAVTSTTGISACNIGGVTLHSWAGLRQHMERMSPDQVLRQMRAPRNVNVVKRWRQVKTLVIDECSMLDPDMLDLLDFLGRKLRNNRLPFGGIQVILCGDFVQLPPVVSSKAGESSAQIVKRRSLISKLQNEIFEKRWLSSGANEQFTKPSDVELSKFELAAVNRQVSSMQKNGRETQFCFDSKSWPHIIGSSSSRKHKLHHKKDGTTISVLGDEPPLKKSMFELVKSFRHDTDPVFNHFLNVVRNSQYKDCSTTFKVTDALFHHLAMPYECRPFDAIFRGLASGNFRNLMDLTEYLDNDRSDGNFFRPSDGIFDANTNQDSGFKYLLNMSHPHDEPVRLFPRRLQAERRNLVSLRALGDLPRFKYDAVDFKKELVSILPSSLLLKEGARVMLLKNIRPTIGLVNGLVGTVSSFTHYSTSLSSSITLPLVTFPIHRPLDAEKLKRMDGTVSFDGRSLTLPITPHLETQPDMEKSMRTGIEHVEPTRLQLPLTLAWCYSIHKSQGQTLQKVEVDVSDLFAFGQLYVALSRTTSLCSLRVVGYSSDVLKWTENHRVSEFYRQLTRHSCD